MAPFLAGILLGAILGASLCWWLLRRLYGLASDLADRQQLKAQRAGLDEVERVQQIGLQAQRVMLAEALAAVAE